MPAAQPVRQLLRIAAHLGTELFQGQPIDPLVPGQSINHIIGTEDGVIADEDDKSRQVTPIDRPTVFPIPNGGSCDADCRGHVFLIQSEFKSATTQVVAEGDGFTGKF